MSGLGRSFAAAQARYDNMAPPDDDGSLTLQEALEQAADEITANPASIMFHLGHLIGEDATSATAHALYSDEWLPDACTAGTLLAVMFEGSLANSEIARVELRDRLAERMRRDIAERADELIEQDEAQRRREAFEQAEGEAS